MADVLTFNAPVLGHVEGVELVRAGEWDASTGLFTADSTTMVQAVEALDCPAVRRPVLKLGHVGVFGQGGDPALGFVDNLRTTADGLTLVGDFRGMPGWLTEPSPNGEGSILSSSYPDRSVECENNYVCQLGHVHPFVVHAVALLGVERPAVGTLQGLAALYGITAASTTSSSFTFTTHDGPGGSLMPALAPIKIALGLRILAEATTDDVRRAYYAGPGQDYNLWIGEMYVDPPELIVHNDADGSIQRVPYTIADDGTVTFGDPERVKVTYVAARSGAGDRAITYSDRAESRPGRPLNPSSLATTEPENTGGDPVAGDTETGGGLTVDLSTDQLARLRETLGLEADADETAIAAALEAPPAESETSSEESGETGGGATAPTLPEGVVAIDAETLSDLQNAAQAGRAANQRFADQDRESALSTAISLGKIPEARRAHYATAWAADPEGTRALLEQMPENLVPVALKGTAGTGETSSDDALLTSLFGPDAAKVG